MTTGITAAADFRREKVAAVLPGVTGAAAANWCEFTPETITLAPFPAVPMSFKAVRVVREPGVTTWVGRNALAGASLVGIGKRDRWDGILTMIGGSFEIHVHDGDVRVVDKSSTASTCDAKPAPLAIGALTPTHAVTANSIHQPTGRTAEVITGNPAVHTSGSTSYTVDLAFFYSKDGETGATQDAGIGTTAQDYLDSLCRGYVATLNLILEQSLVGNLQYHYLGVFRAPDYARVPAAVVNGVQSYEISGDTNAMEDRGQDTGLFVYNKMTALYADEALMIAGYHCNFAGTADVGDSLTNVVAHFAAIDSSSGIYEIAHELGHNYGLQHDRITDDIPDTDTGYEFGFIADYDTRPFGGPGVTQYGDVMAYALRAPYYSNPAVWVTGSSFGSAAIIHPDNNLYVVGTDAGQPRPAYTARTLREMAATMAHSRNDPAQSFPIIAVQPLSMLTVGTGSSLRLSTSATGTNLSYQWRKNGVAIRGATSSTYTQAAATAADAGTYDLVVTNPLGSVITRAAAISVSDQPLTARLVNIATRSPVSTGDDVQIAGFVISGNGPKTVLIRAGGAVLTAAGLHGVLADPTLELHDTVNTIATNDDWSADPVAADVIRSAAVQVGASAWATGSKDAAILMTLSPGAYTAIVRGKNGTTGAAIVEVYELSQASSRVVNIATRSHVGTNDDVQIAGFVVTGDGPKTVLIRAGGAVLTAAGLHGVLADPTLELHDTTSIIGTNDDWSADAAAADAIRSAAVQVGASAWADGSKDAAILATLNPGAYTAIVRGKNTTTGTAIVEVYDVQ